MLEMPSRTIGLVGAVLVLYTRPALAQQPTAEAVQMQQMMVPMMSQMAAVMLESTLTTLAKPENADNDLRTLPRTTTTPYSSAGSRRSKRYNSSQP